MLFINTKLPYSENHRWDWWYLEELEVCDKKKTVIVVAFP
jgi:hypothetical protein